uniref:Geranyl transferase n=1 Tax=Steinernema glaseri TaxID=37863 RepID=A0A1I7YAV3_9BILA
MARCHAAPAQEGVSEAGWLAEAQHLGDAVDRQLVLGQQLLGPFEAQLIEQLLITAAQLVQ